MEYEIEGIKKQLKRIGYESLEQILKELEGNQMGTIKINAKIGSKSIIGENTIIDFDVVIGQRARIWHNCVIRDRVKIGDDSVIGHLVLIEADTVIGNNVTIQPQCYITKLVRIEDKVFLGPMVMCINEKNIASHGRKIKQNLEGPVIGYGARIGAGTQIAPGISIGPQAKIDMGSLVTRDVPGFEHWRGRPAKKIGDVPKEEWVD